MNKFFLLMILLTLFYSCNGVKRDFFQSLKPSSVFLDTFSIANLNGFGLAEKTVRVSGRDYFPFNLAENDVYSTGFFRRVADSLFFLPEGSNTELLFLDLKWDNGSNVGPFSQTTKNQTFYQTQLLGKNYNLSSRDSVYLVKMNYSSLFGRSESIIFSISKNLELISVDHINCKKDTLAIEFFPKEKVYFKHLNITTICL